MRAFLSFGGGIPLRSKRERATDACDDVNESQNNYAESKKLGKRVHTVWTLSYKSLENAS